MDAEVRTKGPPSQARRNRDTLPPGLRPVIVGTAGLFDEESSIKPAHGEAACVSTSAGGLAESAGGLITSAGRGERPADGKEDAMFSR